MTARTVQDEGELGLIARLGALLPTQPDVIVGIGDDAAVVRPSPDAPDDLVLTSDPVTEGTHFTRNTDGEAVGHKAVGRVLSDLAAMGASPDWALLDLAVPPGTPAARIDAIYRGAARIADRYGLSLVGGDTSCASLLSLHVFGIGRVPRGAALLRSGAAAGDILYVTGRLGGSRAGRHLLFEPRIAQGLWLRETGYARAAIDLSDGLARDLPHLAASSGVGARIRLDDIPVSPDALTMDGAATDHALQDGEDFELLFAVSPGNAAAFLSSWRDTFDLPCTAIGVATPDAGHIVLETSDGAEQPLQDNVFRHFGGDEGGRAS